MTRFERAILVATLKANEKIKGNPNHWYPVNIYDPDFPDDPYGHREFSEDLTKAIGYKLELDDQCDLYSDRTSEEEDAEISKRLGELFTKVAAPYGLLVRFLPSYGGGVHTMNVMRNVGLDSDDLDIVSI